MKARKEIKTFTSDLGRFELCLARQDVDRAKNIMCSLFTSLLSSKLIASDEDIQLELSKFLDELNDASLRLQEHLPKHIDISVLHADVFLKFKRYGESKHQIQNVFKKSEQDPLGFSLSNKQWAEAYLIQAQINMVYEQYEKARHQIANALRQDRGNVQAIALLECADQMLGKEREEKDKLAASLYVAEGEEGDEAWQLISNPNEKSDDVIVLQQDEDRVTRVSSCPDIPKQHEVRRTRNTTFASEGSRTEEKALAVGESASLTTESPSSLWSSFFARISLTSQPQAASPQTPSAIQPLSSSQPLPERKII